jgi:hypothetical protein
MEFERDWQRREKARRELQAKGWISPLRIFIGWDSQEPIAFSVAVSSLMRHARYPVIFTPLIQNTLLAAGVYTRERQPNEATEFSLTRFLVPFLSNYEGYSLFLDCDVLARADVHDLLLYALAAPDKAIHVVQHDYVPKSADKFGGHVQTRYAKKNWSSVMLFDNAKCTALTPEYVNTATGLELHRFQWLESDVQIGSLPLEWNHLVGEYQPNPDAKLIHYTLGTPCFVEYAACEHADAWWEEYWRMRKPAYEMGHDE